MMSRAAWVCLAVAGVWSASHPNGFARAVQDAAVFGSTAAASIHAAPPAVNFSEDASEALSKVASTLRKRGSTATGAPRFLPRTRTLKVLSAVAVVSAFFFSALKFWHCRSVESKSTRGEPDLSRDRTATSRRLSAADNCVGSTLKDLLSFAFQR
ncbi:hypothetical protein CSUI_010544 [Cystoisospora suis]|uniref:Transmembrane protein n=1 Tax=Cystoisospora suis TaxID=483139 RepID=A0A2C6KGX5_9APIC|nr:hypothetical protein CSUI_010544 [Cystoisospora suis]